MSNAAASKLTALCVIEMQAAIQKHFKAAAAY